MYELVKRQGKIDFCIGCGKTGMKGTESHVFKRSEKIWFPHESEHGIYSWRISGKKNVYYHPRKSCVTRRNANFSANLINCDSVKGNEGVGDILHDFGLQLI